MHEETGGGLLQGTDHLIRPDCMAIAMTGDIVKN
jgi:hypothetical protein